MLEKNIETSLEKTQTHIANMFQTVPAVNGLRRTPPKENGVDLGLNQKKDAVSPHSGTSSASSTPAPKKNIDEVKPPTPKSTQSTPPSVEGGNALKPGLPGPPYGIGFPPPPGLPSNGNGHTPSETYRPSYDAHPALRAPPIGLPPGGKPYVRFSFLFCPGAGSASIATL